MRLHIELLKIRICGDGDDGVCVGCDEGGENRGKVDDGGLDDGGLDDD